MIFCCVLSANTLQTYKISDRHALPMQSLNNLWCDAGAFRKNMIFKMLSCLYEYVFLTDYNITCRNENIIHLEYMNITHRMAMC